VYKVIGFVGKRRSLVVALSVASALLAAKGHHGYGFGEGTF